MIESSLIHDGFMVTGHKAVQFEETDEIRGGLQASCSRCVKIVWYVWLNRQNSWGQDAPWADRRRYPWTIGSGWSYTIIWWKGCSLASWFSIVLHLSDRVCFFEFSVATSTSRASMAPANPRCLRPTELIRAHQNSRFLWATPFPPYCDGMRWLGPKGISNLLWKIWKMTIDDQHCGLGCQAPNVDPYPSSTMNPPAWPQEVACPNCQRSFCRGWGNRWEPASDAAQYMISRVYQYIKGISMVYE